MIQEIQDALLAQLRTVQGLPPLQAENELYLAKGAPFARATWVYSRPGTLSVGLNGKDLHSDFVQVDLLFPANTGTAAANGLADAVVAAFPRGLTLPVGDGDGGVADGIEVKVVKSFRETAARLNDQYHLAPVRIEYRVII